MSSFVANGPLPSGPAIRPLAIYAGGIAGLAVLFTAAGAFDTDHLTIAHRLALWTLVAALIIGQAAGADHLASNCLKAMPAGRILAALIAIAATILLLAVELHLLKFTPLLPKQPDPPLEFLGFVAPPVGAIAAVVLLLRTPPTALARPARTRAATKDDALPGWPAAPVSTLRARDHYLELTTPAGTCLVRGRMQDALARLAEEDGLQVHRSWWVARTTVARIGREGRDLVLHLEDGSTVPVSRSRVDALRAAGWL